MFKKVMIVVLAYTVSVPSFSDVTKTSGMVSDVWMFAKNYSTYNTSDTGLAMIYLEGSDMEPACGNQEYPKRVAISTDHPLYDSVVSLALTAKTANKKVELWYLDTCTQRSSAWDFGLIRFVE